MLLFQLLPASLHECPFSLPIRLGPNRRIQQILILGCTFDLCRAIGRRLWWLRVGPCRRPHGPARSRDMPRVSPAPDGACAPPSPPLSRSSARPSPSSISMHHLSFWPPLALHLLEATRLPLPPSSEHFLLPRILQSSSSKEGCECREPHEVSHGPGLMHPCGITVPCLASWGEG